MPWKLTAALPDLGTGKQLLSICFKIHSYQIKNNNDNQLCLHMLMHPRVFQRKPSVVLRPCNTVTTMADWWTEPKRMEQIVLATLFIISVSPKNVTLSYRLIK